VFDDELDERVSPGLPSHANARSLVKGVVVSVIFHGAVLAVLLLSALRDGDVAIARRLETTGQTATQVTLLPAPEPAAAKVLETKAPGTPSIVQPVPALVSSDRMAAVNQPTAVMPGITAGAPTNAQAVTGAASSAPASGMAALGSDYRRRLLEYIAAHRKTPPAGAQGTVLVRFSLARGGDVTAVAITVSSGDTVLDRTAIDSVRGASPMPAIPAGFPDQLSVVLPIDFGRVGQKELLRP
jgi:periplasmic protein TonB